MTYVHQIQIEFRREDSGDLTAKVTERKGSSGENPPTEVHHDSHFLDNALRELGRVARKAAKEVR